MQREVSDFQRLEQCGIQVDKGLHYADDDAVFYLELLMMFIEDREKKQKQLETVWEDIANRTEDRIEWEKWVVTCHSLKGEARGIGASELGEYFYQLEMAGREKDTGKIKENYSAAMKEWEKVVEGIRTMEKGESL